MITKRNISQPIRSTINVCKIKQHLQGQKQTQYKTTLTHNFVCSHNKISLIFLNIQPTAIKLYNAGIKLEFNIYAAKVEFPSWFCTIFTLYPSVGQPGVCKTAIKTTLNQLSGRSFLNNFLEKLPAPQEFETGKKVEYPVPRKSRGSDPKALLHTANQMRIICLATEYCISFFHPPLPEERNDVCRPLSIQ